MHIMSPLGEILYLSRLDIERLDIPMREVIRLVKETFIEKAEKTGAGKKLPS